MTPEASVSAARTHCTLTFADFLPVGLFAFIKRLQRLTAWPESMVNLPKLTCLREKVKLPLG